MKKSQLEFQERGPIPSHVAFIMDGNRRWARSRMLPVIAGHRTAMSRINPLVRECQRLGVRYMTFFAFSTENWKRPQDQVNDLMGLFYETLRDKILELEENKVRVKFIGDRSRLESRLLKMMEETESRTAQFFDQTSIQVNIALNYGARWDILQAAERLCSDKAQQKISDTPISPEAFEAYLSTAGIPDPDLLVRTSGEHRLSNFLLWQMAYTELYFTETLWPDFDLVQLHKAFAAYQRCERRFGGDASDSVS